MRLQSSFKHGKNIERVTRENIAEFSEVREEGLTIDTTKRSKARYGRASIFLPF